MCAENGSPNGHAHPVPAPGTLVVDTSRADRVAEFRGIAGPYWSLRPVCGGQEWEADPEDVRPVDR
ncbi:hypothetical protein PUR49_36820, partial [Streptomyces sp. BE147]|uniref:hypothetical protein n=1 Tax=Streptomyces sp. BE147 TaxID=3002524 RepID=UPI002E75A1D9